MLLRNVSLAQRERIQELRGKRARLHQSARIVLMEQLFLMPRVQLVAVHVERARRLNTRQLLVQGPEIGCARRVQVIRAL